MRYIAEEKYRDIIKVEFKDMIEKFLPPRKTFHAYTIGRACTHSTMLGFDYTYYVIEGRTDVIGKRLDLGYYGTIDFEIECQSNYGTIASEDSEEVIQHFLQNYSTQSKITSSLPTT